ncbi:DUF3618 domain-containing protein [Rhodospirillum centenum]|uniref:DUF3618 domain-containing protein n=1 Tax=Rhodospirillum centenum (strain ATCC 51521 / SW) TaxID=414684 RepID=B6INY4_RHOCS|nr:DUF3618 domain-containing protein [Rhodospirillum centenum]ACI99404.1 hypothetical protein RC1_2011 [Rhodospirillum centenum SW]
MATRSEEIEREIEETRRGMSRTAAEIERRLQPESLLDGAVTWVRTSRRGRAMTEDVLDVVARNPLPLALIGVGVAWLAWEMTRHPSSGSASRYTPMRQRLGPDPRAETHHSHVEDDGRAARPGQAPGADEIIGRQPGTQSAREAAEVFRDSDRNNAGTGSGAAGAGTGAVPGEGKTAGARPAMAEDVVGYRAGGHSTAHEAADPQYRDPGRS